MSHIPTVHMDAEEVKQADESASFLLNIPVDRAKERGGKRMLSATEVNPKYNAQWNELLDIVDADMSVVEEEEATENLAEGTVRVTVKFIVSPKSEHLENMGKTVTQRYFINVQALRGPASKQKTMTLMSCNKLNSILRAVGFEVGGTGVTYNDYFLGPNPVVVGQSCNGLIRHYIGKKDGREYQEVSSFSPEGTPDE